MKKVTGLGGILFKCQDPVVVRNWYKTHLGIGNSEYGHSFFWNPIEEEPTEGRTEWCPFKADTSYFQPSNSEFMINFRVENLEDLLMSLKAEGVQQVGDMETYSYGKFAWILDPEGRKIELWQPLAENNQEGAQ